MYYSIRQKIKKGVKDGKMRRFSRLAAIVVSLTMLLSLSGAAAFSSEEVTVEKTITQITEYFK